MRTFISDYIVDGEYILAEANHYTDEEDNTYLEFFFSIHDGDNTVSFNEGFVIPEDAELDPQAAEDYLEKIRMIRDIITDYVKEAEEAAYQVVNPPTNKEEVN